MSQTETSPLTHMIPTPKIRIQEKVDRPLRYLKYVFLFLFVFALPFFYRTSLGTGDPFFCKYMCPLGAFYSLFQKVSLLKMSFDENACVNCGTCARTCKMNVNPIKSPNSAECIRCGECVKACPKSALKFNVIEKKKKVLT